MGLIARYTQNLPGKMKMSREQLIGLIQSDAKFIDERDDIAEYIRGLAADQPLEEKEIRAGEALKPMILNATNSKVLKGLCNSPFIEDWQNVRVTIYVDGSVRFGKETVEGLRISPRRPEKPLLTPESVNRWNAAKEAYKRDKNLDSVLARVHISEEHQEALKSECAE